MNSFDKARNFVSIPCAGGMEEFVRDFNENNGRYYSNEELAAAHALDVYCYADFFFGDDASHIFPRSDAERVTDRLMSKLVELSKAGAKFDADKALEIAVKHHINQTREDLVNEIEDAKSLDELYELVLEFSEFLKSFGCEHSQAFFERFLDDLPVFGPEPRNTAEIYSWDDERALHICGDIKIIDREDV